jgi:Flagellar hook-length control protein FliK
MTMRLIPTIEHELGRLNSSKMPKLVGPDFSDEVQKQKNKHADFEEIIKQKQEGNSLAGEISEDDHQLESDQEFAQVGVGEIEPLDEQTLAEGVRLFGSLFSLIEERLAAAANGYGNDQRSSSLLVESSGFEVEGSVRAIAAKPGMDAVVIDLATVRNRVAANIKNPLDDRHLSQGQAAIARSASSDNQRPSGYIIAAEVATVDNPLQFPKQDEEFESPINVGIDNEFKLQTSEPALPSQSIAAPTTRVDQIARAVVEQTQQLSAAQATTGMRELYANIAGQTLRMSLHPVELGSLEITVSKRGKRLEVTVSPEIAGTGQLLLEDVSALARSIGAADKAVEHVQVRILLADGSIESHDAGDLLQFATRQETGTHSGGERPARTAHDRPSQHEGSSDDGIRISEKEKYSASQRQSGAVYL